MIFFFHASGTKASQLVQPMRYLSSRHALQAQTPCIPLERRAADYAIIVQLLIILSMHILYIQVEPKVQKLYDYIRERGTILPIHEYSKELLSKDDVHKRVAESIRSGKLFYPSSP